MFSAYIEEASELLSTVEARSGCTAMHVRADMPAWPRQKDQMIFAKETACDFGPAGVPSISLLLLTGQSKLVEDGAITLIGPDIPECKGREMAFGKIVLVQGVGFDDDNLYKRYQQMNLQRFDLGLQGCVPRAVPQKNREWLRIGKDAMAAGFDFETLGTELYRQLHTLEYVQAAETVFITSGEQDVEVFESLSQRLGKAVFALNKMTEHLAYDCDECDCRDVCNEIDGLRRMHKRAAAEATQKK